MAVMQSMSYHAKCGRWTRLGFACGMLCIFWTMVAVLPLLLGRQKRPASCAILTAAVLPKFYMLIV